MGGHSQDVATNTTQRPGVADASSLTCIHRATHKPQLTIKLARMLVGSCMQVQAVQQGFTGRLRMTMELHEMPPQLFNGHFGGPHQYM